MRGKVVNVGDLIEALQRLVFSGQVDADADVVFLNPNMTEADYIGVVEVDHGFVRLLAATES